MNLREWLDAEIMQIVDFAEKIGVSRLTVYNWLYKSTKPLRITQLIVQKETGGKVTLESWETLNEQKKADKRLRGTKDNGLRVAQHMVVDKKAKPKSSKGKR
jgi:hypothetical protein